MYETLLRQCRGFATLYDKSDKRELKGEKKKMKVDESRYFDTQMSISPNPTSGIN